MKMGEQLTGVSRCPHCSVASPFFYNVWHSENGKGTLRIDGGKRVSWGFYLCRSCGGGIATEGLGEYHHNGVRDLYPKPKSAHEDLPAVARTFLQQAFDTIHAPDAAAMIAGSAVDAMLKEKGFVKGSLYSRIDEALEANLLTKGMSEWAHSVRLGSNRPRHADAESPHVSPDEAKQSVEFAEALGNFLFVLTAKIERGIEAANAAE